MVFPNSHKNTLKLNLKVVILFTYISSSIISKIKMENPLRSRINIVPNLISNNTFMAISQNTSHKMKTNV